MLSDGINFLFDASQYPARWQCGHWLPLVGWTHILSDSLIFLSYTAIPISILYYQNKLKAKAIEFNYIFYLFASFIFFCGATHLIEVIIFWDPIYNFAGLIKLITGIISACTFVVIATKLPSTLKFINEKHDLNDMKQKLDKIKAEEAQHALDLAEKQNAKLREIDKLKSDFLATISHELRTPLTLIMGPLEMILSEPSSLSDEHKENLQRMQRNALRLYMLVNDVLDFSKLESGKFTVHEDVVDLNNQVNQIVLDAQGLAKERKITLDYTACENLAPILLDNKMVDKVIMNLISNALKFTPEGGQVKVQLQKDINFVKLIVQDTGIGIPKSHMKHLFERFHQVDTSSNRAYEGSGIGLALVKQFTALLNGKIDVQSEEKKGTTFTVTLPIRHISDQKANQSLETPVKPINTSLSLLCTENVETKTEVTGKFPLVLIVDDNDDMRSYIVSLLKNSYEIITAKNGKEALDAIYKYQPQVILTDIMMPIMDGYEFTKTAKADPSIKHIPIIMITAKTGDEHITSGLKIGANDFLSKPFSADELLARTGAALRTYQNFLKLKELNQQMDAANKKLSDAYNELEVTHLALKNAQTAMIQQSTLASIGQLAAGVAHEINTPIQYVGDNTRFLQNSFTDMIKYIKNEPSNNNLDNIDVKYLSQEIPLAIQQSLEGIGRVSDIVKTMKDFSHPGAAEKTPTDINRCLQSTINISKNEWKYFAQVNTEFDPNLPLTACVRNEINQVFLNLILNAAHSIEMKDSKGEQIKGKIDISTRKDGKYTEIRISDTGIGIPDSIKSRIFEPFFTTKEVGKGTGQGLSIAHAIVSNHKGQIHFESKVGQGTTFIIRLPIN
jgi:signal transduction histidine kinase